MIRILDIARTRHGREAGDNRLGTFDEVIVFGDEHEGGGLAPRRNDHAFGERRVINLRRSSSGIAQIDPKVGVRRAGAVDDEVGIGAVRIGGAKLRRPWIFQGKGPEANHREQRRINGDFYGR